MTLLEKISNLTWYDLIDKLKLIFTDLSTSSESTQADIEALQTQVDALVEVPTPPTTGTHALQSIEGVLTWVEVV